uniref:HDC14632 n=1 Tax=Drosophila melanogaster TaxID=7227 RepID=Q6IJL7_DROME|nr:TPA_inf: HDC14632 [Drosophila melanogaster]
MRRAVVTITQSTYYPLRSCSPSAPGCGCNGNRSRHRGHKVGETTKPTRHVQVASGEWPVDSGLLWSPPNQTLICQATGRAVRVPCPAR